MLPGALLHDWIVGKFYFSVGKNILSYLLYSLLPPLEQLFTVLPLSSLCMSTTPLYW